MWNTLQFFRNRETAICALLGKGSLENTCRTHLRESVTPIQHIFPNHTIPESHLSISISNSKSDVRFLLPSLLANSMSSPEYCSCPTKITRQVRLYGELGISCTRCGRTLNPDLSAPCYTGPTQDREDSRTGSPIDERYLEKSIRTSRISTYSG